MLASILPIVAILLIVIGISVYNYYSTEETFVNPRSKDAAILKEIQMKAKLNPQEEARVNRMFDAYWKVSKESSQKLIVNTFDKKDIPAWVKTEQDVQIFLPYIIPYMVGKSKSLPQTKEEAIAEKFTNMEGVEEKVMDLDKIDDMTDDELQDNFRKTNVKEMSPAEAEKHAYKTLKHLANSDFNDDFYNALAYVSMSFAQKASPKASPEAIRDLGLEVKQQLPPAIAGLQMEARSLFRKVEAAKKKEDKKRRSKTLKQIQSKDGTFRLDREAYMKSLPEYKKIMMEGFAGSKDNKEGFYLIAGIFKAIFSPIIKIIIKTLMPLITSFIEIGINALVAALPMLINGVALPLINAIIDIVTNILANPQVMDAIMSIIKSLINIAIDVGYSIIKALSVPILQLFFKMVAPLIITTVRFVIFMFRMAVRLAVTVWNLIVSFVMKNWRYVKAAYNWVVDKVIALLIFIYNFLEPYIQYALYIATPLLLIFLIIQIGPSLFTFLNTLVALGMNATPERTFRPTQALTDNA